MEAMQILTRAASEKRGCKNAFGTRWENEGTQRRQSDTRQTIFSRG